MVSMATANKVIDKDAVLNPLLRADIVLQSICLVDVGILNLIFWRAGFAEIQQRVIFTQEKQKNAGP